MNENKVHGSALAAPGVKITVALNDEVIDRIANSAATTIHLSNASVANIISVDDTKACFAYALASVLGRDSGSTQKREVVPGFLSDITFSLGCVYRHVHVDVDPIEVYKRPDSYTTFIDVLSGLGIPCGPVLNVDKSQGSAVLKLGIIEVNGADMLVGIEGDVSIEELVVRAMLSISEAENQKLRNVMGCFDNMYVAVDEIVRQWASSLPVGKR